MLLSHIYVSLSLKKRVHLKINPSIAWQSTVPSWNSSTGVYFQMHSLFWSSFIDLQKVTKIIQFPLILTSYLTMEHLSKLRSCPRISVALLIEHPPMHQEVQV